MKSKILNSMLALILGILIVGCQVKQKTAVTPTMLHVKGEVLWTQNYCGGAPPTQEMITELQTARPLPSHKFFIKQGTTNQLDKPVLHEVLTDAFGKFEIKLPLGEYVVIMEAQRDKNILTSPGAQIVVSQKEKLASWWSSGLARINSSNQDIKMKLHQNCNVPIGIPFLRYTGPVAP